MDEAIRKLPKNVMRHISKVSGIWHSVQNSGSAIESNMRFRANLNWNSTDLRCFEGGTKCLAGVTF